MFRKEIYPIERVLPFIGSEERRINFDGDFIKIDTLRLMSFKVHGITCVKCGIKGEFFAKEKHKGDVSYHFNLYARNQLGEEVLMTRDHIIPLSKGGSEVIENLQTMCSVCNQIKDNKVVT